MTRHEFELLGIEVVDFLEAYGCTFHEKLHVTANIACCTGIGAGLDRVQFIELMSKLYDCAQTALEMESEADELPVIEITIEDQAMLDEINGGVEIH